jgi:hypothetical protein
MPHDETNALPGSGKTTPRIIRALALIGVSVAACLLISCQSDSGSAGASGDVKLSLLEWSGYEHPKYYPEFVAKYGGEPAFTFFAQADAAMKRMRTGYQVDVVHLCTGQMAEAWDAGLIKARSLGVGLFDSWLQSRGH